MSMDMDLMRRTVRCSRIEKNRKNVIREKMNIKKFCFRLYKIQTVKLVWSRVKDGPRKAPQKNFRMLPTWKTKKGKTSEFLDAGGCNMNERAGNWRLGMGQQRGVEKENCLP